MGYTWDYNSLKEARIMKRRRVPHDQVKTILDSVKGLMKREQDSEVKSDLVKAGICLNRILMR